MSHLQWDQAKIHNKFLIINWLYSPWHEATVEKHLKTSIIQRARFTVQPLITFIAAAVLDKTVIWKLWEVLIWSDGIVFKRQPSFSWPVEINWSYIRYILIWAMVCTLYLYSFKLSTHVTLLSCTPVYVLYSRFKTSFAPANTFLFLMWFSCCWFQVN